MSNMYKQYELVSKENPDSKVVLDQPRLDVDVEAIAACTTRNDSGVGEVGAASGAAGGAADGAGAAADAGGACYDDSCPVRKAAKNIDRQRALWTCLSNCCLIRCLDFWIPLPLIRDNSDSYDEAREFLSINFLFSWWGRIRRFA